MNQPRNHFPDPANLNPAEDTDLPEEDELEDQPSFSRFLWLPCAWLFINSSRILIGLSLDTIRDAQDIGTLKAQLTYFTLIILGAVCLATRKIDWRSIIRSNMVVILFFVYMALSIAWSDYPIVALKRYVKTVGILIMALIIVTDQDPYNAFLTVFRRTYRALVGISGLFIFLIPSYGIRGDVWLGVTSHKNELGELTCIGAIFFLSQILEKGINKESRYDIFYLLLAMVILFNSNSMTSMVIFVFAISLFVLFRLKVNSRFVGTFIVFIYIFGLTSFIFLDNLFAKGLVGNFFEAIGRDMTFTGRNELWADVIAIAMKRPWFGYGYESFWIEDIHNLWEIYIWRPNQGHSGYVDLFATLGFAGIAMVIVMVGSTFLHASRQMIQMPTVAKLRMIYLLGLMWYNFSESSLCTSATSGWVLFIYVIVSHKEGVLSYIESHYPYEHFARLRRRQLEQTDEEVHSAASGHL